MISGLGGVWETLVDGSIEGVAANSSGDCGVSRGAISLRYGGVKSLILKKTSLWELNNYENKSDIKLLQQLYVNDLELTGLVTVTNAAIKTKYDS